MAKRSQKNKPIGYMDSWQDAVEIPKAGLPDAIERENRWRKVRRSSRTLAFLVMLSAFAVVVMAFSVVGNLNDDPVAEGVPSTSADALGHVTSWLNTTPSPIPGAQVAGWVSYIVTNEAAPDAGDGASDGLQRETHTVSLITANDTSVNVQVQVAVDAHGRATMIGTPAISSVLPRDTESAPSPWVGLPSADVGETGSKAIENWAKALTSSDPAALALAVGDTDTTHAYVPLVGVQNVTTTVTGGAWLVDSSGNQTGDAIASVQMRIEWVGEAYTEESLPAVFTYDVLLRGASSAAPVVTAWGGSGTGPSLTDFINHVPADMAGVVLPITPNVTTEGLPTETAPGATQGNPAVEPGAEAPVDPATQTQGGDQ